MKNKLLLVLVFISSFLSAQNIVGSWEGTLKVSNVELPLIIHIQREDGNYTSTFDSPKQGAKGIPLTTTSFENGKLHLEAQKFNISYDGRLEFDTIKGEFKQNGMTFPLELKRMNQPFSFNRPQTPKPPFHYNEKEVFIKNNIEGNQLAGTLVTPKNTKNKNFPILVMITGSGSQDRNETLFGHQPFWVIADYLAQKGIGSLRLDDRGIGKSEKGKKGATTADFATDISSAVDYLVAQNFTNIGLLGHSEGGMIAPMVAIKNPKVKFQILLSAPGVPIKDLMIKQTSMLTNTSNMESKNSQLYDFIIHYQGKNLKTDIEKWIRQNFINDIPKEQLNAFAKQQSQMLSHPWFVYFIQFNPDDYLAKTKIPTLALNGSLDRQVSAKENLNGITKSLQKANNQNFKIVEIKGLNHLFQTAKTGHPNEYAEIEETFSPKALKMISDWVLSHKKN
ncbi:MAG: alpha/beta hydrolase [Flavobacteriales bacterium]|nr:MAG: alpha/beta hydrolase [Flavobacteriales bacterium]